jgi:enterochelin esterase-like enzyme
VRQDVDLPLTFTPRSPATIPPASTHLPAMTEMATITPVPFQMPLPSPAAVTAVRLVPADSNRIPYYDQPPQEIDCDASGLLFRSRFPSGVGGPWRSYHAYLPPCYRSDGRVYPVLYLFHGSIQTDSHWPDLGLKRQMDAGIGDGRLPPFIAIMPFNGEIGNKTSGNAHSIEGITINFLLPYVDASLCTLATAAGRGIGGISRGGYWSLMIAFRHPDQFAAVSGHSSHLRLETDEAGYNPLATYAQADLSHMRIWLDWGETDFLRPGQQQLHDLLENAGIRHEAYVNPGGHNDAYWLAHLGQYLAWHGSSWPRDQASYSLCSR